MIRRLLSRLLPPVLTSDEEIERELQRLRQKEEDRGMLFRMMDHPVGFMVLFFGLIFGALGLMEMLCTLLGAPFDPRLG